MAIDLDVSQKAKIFDCLQCIDLDQLDGVEDKTCALPFLTKLLLNPFFSKRKRVLQILYHTRKSNDMLQLLQTRTIEPIELTNGLDSLTDLNFESASARDRLKIVALECLRIQEMTRLQTNNCNSTTSQQHNNSTNTKLQKSPIFDNPLYVEDVSLCLFALLHKATGILVINLIDLVETLLHVKHGPAYISQLVINTPDRCQEVCQSLITLGENLDESAAVNEISDNRANTLRAICQLSPNIGFKARALAIQLRLVPSLTIMLSLDQLRRALDQSVDLEDSSQHLRYIREVELNFESAITFVIGLLQDEDEASRIWFARYIRAAQQKRTDQNYESILTEFRSQIVLSIKKLFPLLFEADISHDSISDHKLDEQESDEKFLNRKLLHATATLRYFCSLRGIGMLKLNQEESEILLNLITCKPPSSQTSINFITTGVCTLLVCSSILSTHKEERRGADWLKWLLREFGDETINEFLNSIARHFQTNQINQISELVCSKLGMRLQIKAFISKSKPLFVQEAFNNSLVLGRPVEETDGRTSELKYEFPIKDWMYRKIYEYDEFLRVEMVGIRPKSISQDRIGELKQQLADGFVGVRDDPLSLLRVVNRILQLPRDGVWTFIEPFMEHWSDMLELDAGPDGQKLIKAITKLWWRFNTIQPRDLWIMTINSLQRAQPLRLYAETEYTWTDLAHDPLIVLKCDIRVFRNHRLLDIVLHILSVFLEASKRCLQSQIDDHPNRQKDNRNLEELRSTLVLAQTSAAIQILLEYCIPDVEEREILRKKEEGCQLNERETTLFTRFNECVDCICEHLHQVFIADTNLAKLVHFQTYPSDLLAMTTDKVPSMHICLDYIPELLSQPDLPKQVFVIQLTSHLCEKYAITKSLNCAKLCFNVAFTLLQILPSDKRALFYVPALPALMRICRVFPILQEDARIILNQVHQVTLAHMASTSSRLGLSSSCPLEGLHELNWHRVKDLMRSLSLDEALYLCIQKCLIDLERLEDKYKRQNQSSMMIENSQRPVYNTTFAYGSHVTNPN